MKTNRFTYSLLLAGGLFFASCQDDKIEVSPAKIGAVSNLTYTLNGDTAALSWSLPQGATLSKVVLGINGENKDLPANSTSYKYGIVETNKEYAFTIKLGDAGGNLSLGQTVMLSRAGAAPVKNLSAEQNDNGVLVSWAAPSMTVSKIQAKIGTQSIDLGANATSHQFNNVPKGDYNISVITYNSSNQVSNTVYLPFKVGATAVGYLGMYADSTALLNTGDDDEIAAAKWLFKTYNKSEYISFNEIKNGTVDLSQFRVLWWNYDQTNTHALPASSTDATVVNKIKEFHKNGGGLLFNQYAMQYLWNIGRMTENYFVEFGDGAGFNNPDPWGVGINIGRKNDNSSHPVFRNIALTTHGDNRKTFLVVGAGWKENHNAVIVRIPEYLNLLPNDNDAAFTKFESDNNAEWLAVWDGIGDYFMTGISEFKPKGDFKGTSIFIGIGGIEWNQNSGANPYQGTIETLYKNSIDYLKTK